VLSGREHGHRDLPSPEASVRGDTRRVVPNFGENKKVVGQILKHMFVATLHVFSMYNCDVTYTKNINFRENSKESIGASLRTICSTMCVCVYLPIEMMSV
jgi:hypothetical protein